MKQQADKEFSAMRRVVEILNALSPAARKRVLAYAADRIGDAPAPQPGPAPDGQAKLL